MLAIVAAALIPWLGTGRAEAQYGFGGYGGYGGYGGWGFGYNPNAYSDVNFLNQRALINGANAATANNNNNTNNQVSPPVPRFESRDTSFYDKYDLATRESMINRIARDPAREMGTADPSGILPRQATSTPPTPPPASSSSSSTSTSTPSSTSPPAPPSTVNLANYFNKDHQLVWPSVAPVTGEFAKKQAIANQAVLAVFNEYELNGLAQLSTVTNARQKLLDYGRPALQYVNEHSTPALADSFHVFLLSIYGNVGNAATVPKAP